MDNENEDKQKSKPKSKLLALKNRFYPQHKSVQNIQHHVNLTPNHNSITISNIPIHKESSPFKSQEKASPDFFYESGRWSSGTRKKKTSFDIHKSIREIDGEEIRRSPHEFVEKKKESRIHKFLQKKPSTESTITASPTNDKSSTGLVSVLKPSKQVHIQEENRTRYRQLSHTQLSGEHFPGSSISPTSFLKSDRHKISLPVVEIENKSAERPLGLVFLTFREETKRSLLPNEITSLSTVWALFVRAFPDHLSMSWFELTRVTIYILNPITKLYCPLKSLKEITDRSALKIFEEEAIMKSKAIRGHPSLLSNSSHQAWRRIANGRSSDRLFENNFEEENLSATLNSRFFHSPQFNGVQINRQDVIRSAPPTSRETALSPDYVLYKAQDFHQQQCSPTVIGIARQESLQSSTSANSDISQATVIRSPLRGTPTSPLTRFRPSYEQTNSVTHDMKRKMSNLRHQAKALQQELCQLKEIQQEHVAVMKDTFLAATSKCEELLTSVNRDNKQALGREVINTEKSGYSDDVCLVESKLKELEFSVDELKDDVLTRRSKVQIGEINNMTQILNHVAKLLSELKGRLQTLQKSLRPLIVAEIGEIMHDERFVKGEPTRLESLLNRCKHLAAILNTLKKLALIQENSNFSGNRQENKTNSNSPIENRFSQPVSNRTATIISSQSSENLRNKLDHTQLNKCATIGQLSKEQQQLYKKLIFPAEPLSNNLNQQQPRGACSENVQNQSKDSLPREGFLNQTQTALPALFSTQSAPSTPQLITSRAATLRGPLSYENIARNEFMDSDNSLSLYSSSNSSSPSTSEKNLIMAADYRHHGVPYAFLDSSAMKQQLNCFLPPGYAELGQRLQMELMNELIRCSGLNQNLQMPFDFDLSTYENGFDVAQERQKNCADAEERYATLKRVGALEPAVGVKSSQGNSNYKSLDQLLDKNIQMQQKHFDCTQFYCPYCSEDKRPGQEAARNHKEDCPYQVHEAIVRLSKAAGTESDIEMSLCAKLSRAHLQEQLKQRQEQIQIQKQQHLKNDQVEK